MFQSTAPATRALATSRAVICGIGKRRCLANLNYCTCTSVPHIFHLVRAREGVKTMAHVPEVDVTQYEAQLLAKVEKVKQLFADYKTLPDFEVCILCKCS